MKRILSARIPVTMILAWVLAVSGSTGAPGGEDTSTLGRRWDELYRAGKYEEALPIAQRIVELCKIRAKEEPANYAASLGNLAELYHNMGDYGRAEPLYKQALAIYKDALGEKHPEYAASLNNLALLYHSMGDYAHAEILYKQSLAIRKETLGEKHPGYATGLNNLANLYHGMGDYGRAEPLYKQALAIRKKILGEKHPDYAASLNNLASLYDDMGDYGHAEPLYKQALAIRKVVLGEKHPDYAGSLNNLAALYDSMGDYGRAEPLYKQALAIRKEVLGEKHPDYAASLNNLAGLYYKMGDYGRAEPLYKQALAIQKEALGEKHPYYAASLNNLARLYHSMGDYGRAEPLYTQALAIKKEAVGEKHPDYATSLQNLGVLYGCVKKPELALEYQEASLGSTAAFLDEMALWASEKRQETYAAAVEGRYDHFYSLLARFFAGRGGAAEAKHALETHLAYKGRSLEALATRNRLALVSGDPRLARIVEKLANVVRQIANLSFAGPGKGDPAAHKQRIAQLEEKKESLESDLARGSAEYAERGAARKATADGVAAALPKRGLYLDFVEYTRYDYDAAKWTKERRYLAFLLVPKSEGGAAVRFEDLGPADEINALARRFRAALCGESGPGGAGNPKGAGNPGGEGNPGAAADSGAPARKIGTRPSAAAQRIETPEAQRIRTAGARLYEKILRPFDAEIQRGGLIVVSPAGELNLIPFEVLPAPSRQGYLMDHWAVAYSLGRDLVGEAFRVKSLAVRERKDVDAAQIVAAPDFDRTAESGAGPVAESGGARIAMAEGETRTLSSRLPARTVLKEWPIRVGPLPGTLAEGRMIQAKLPGGQGKLWSGPEAEEGVVKAMKQPRFLHFATHGFFLEDVARAAPDERAARSIGIKPAGAGGSEDFLAASPLKGPPELHNPLLRSGLALAGFNRLADGVDLPLAANDGILTAMEVTGLDLNGAGLAVLSACETGLGETRRGEGVAGLRRAFRIAGARNVLMSLWNVPDQETVWLMGGFYDAYLGGAPPAAALAKARKTVRERLLARDGFDNPRYWAAFVVEGPSLFGQER